MVRFLAVGTALLALYLTLISTVGPLELAVGSAGGALGGLAAVGAARVVPRREPPPRRTPPHAALRLAGAWCRDCAAGLWGFARLAVRPAEARRTRGRYSESPPADAVDPATGAFWLSATPGSYAVDLDDDGCTTRHSIPLGPKRTAGGTG